MKKTVMFEKPVDSYSEAIGLLPLRIDGTVDFIWKNDVIVGYTIDYGDGQEARHDS